MSRECMVIIVQPDERGNVDGAPAKVFMRFTEEPDADFLQRLATSQPGKRVYCLIGASTWHEVEK